MNLASILQQIADTKTSTFEEVSPRRQLLANLVPKLGLAALPLGLSALINPAKAHTVAELSGVLNYLLKLEMLLYGYYEQGLATPGLIPAENSIAITQMSGNSLAHRNFIKGLVESHGGTPISEPAFDYSGGNGLGTGPYADAFAYYPRFLGLAQMFEETTIRAYQGVIPHLMADPDTTMSCMQVFTVKGRHAAKLRQIRREQGFSTAKNWITQAQSGIPSNPTGPTWNGEDNTDQLGVPVANIGINIDAVTEAFDEPLTQAAVEAILDPFIG